MTKKKPFIRLRPKLDPVGEGYPQPMRGLLTLGKPKEDTDYVAWAEQLRGHVPQLIQMALDDNLNSRSEKDRAVWAPLHALSILAELAPVEAAEPLLAILTWDDDWTTEPLLAYYGRVGKPAAPLLKQRVLDTGLEIAARGRAVAALQAIAETHAEERDDIVNFLAHYLEHGAADTLDEEYVVTSAVLTLTDLRAVEALPAIERAFEEDRVETFMITLDNVKRAFDPAAETEEEPDEDDAPSQGVNLSLKCLSCGRDRRYSFDRAYFDMSVVEHADNSAFDKALYIPEPVVCPRCGTIEQYELGTFGQIAFTATLTALMSNQPNPIPDLKLMNFPPAPWGWLPPREALARYRTEIAAKPTDLKLRVHYGDALAMVDEPDAAIEQYEQALLIDPLCGNALFGLADQMSDHAEIADAIAVWERIERDAPGLAFFDGDEMDLATLRQLTQRALSHLRAGERLPPSSELDLDDEEAIEDAFAAGLEHGQTLSPQQLPAYPETFVTPERGEYGKVGRNEPCPCGSGKKYKQCHGRK